MTATQVQSRKGTQAEIDAFTGANAEIVVNTSNNSVVVQNGSTAGGFEAMRADLANANAGSAALTTGSLTTGALTATTLTGNDTSLTGSSSGSTVLTLTSNALTDTPLMVFQRTGGAVAGKLAYEDTNTAMSFGTTTAHELKLLTNNTNRLEIDSSGNATFSGSVTIADDSDPTLLIRTATADQANSGKISFREASGGTTGVDLRYNGNTNKFIIDTTDVSNALTIARTSGNASFTANVGIGDSDPGYPLAIQADGIAMRLDGTANTTRSIFFRNTTTANPAQIYSDGSLKLYTEDADTTIGFMSASTKVGVGTMSPAAAKFSGSATGLLNVYGTMPVVAVTESDVSDSEIYMGITGGTGYIGKSGAGSLILSTGATSTATALTLDNSQNATFAGDVAVDKYLRLRTTDDQANQWYLYSHTDDTFRINYNGAGDDAITIDTSENVGIGVTAPNANSKLEVDGRVRIGAGSTALPALTGSGDYDTGVWWGGSDILGFSTAGAERMRLDSNGDLYIGSGIFLGGTGSANKLDDYEEGTWTPTYIATTSDFSSVTYSSQVGTYTKIGNQVTVWFNVRTSGVSGGSGTVKISGLPFAANISPNVGPAVFSAQDAWVSAMPNIGWVDTNSQLVLAYGTDSSTTYATITPSNMSNSSNSNRVYGCATYTTT